MAVEPLVRALERVVPPAAALARVVRTLALAALASAAVLAVALFAGGLPEPETKAAVAALVAAAAAVPGVVLLLFWRALVEALELPARLRALPGTGREHAEELQRLLRRRSEQRGWRRAWRLVALGHSARELLAPHAPLVALLSPPFLAAAALSALATPVVAAVALIAALVRLA